MKYFFVIVAEAVLIVCLVMFWRSASRSQDRPRTSKTLFENFTEPVEVFDGIRFGEEGFLTFELFRDGTFAFDAEAGIIEQRSPSYRDAAYIRSTDPLAPTYCVRATVGMIEYDLDNITGLANDPEYREGPRNENGCYLLAIVDEKPSEHYTNDWWHEHRKVVIDVDNNVWGHGMPHPIFMVAFDRGNELIAFDEKTRSWSFDWVRGWRYEKNRWYGIEIERTKKEFILRIYDDADQLLQEAVVPLDEVWRTESNYPDYFVIGDPHENYYQGSMQIRDIRLMIDY